MRTENKIQRPDARGQTTEAGARGSVFALLFLLFATAGSVPAQSYTIDWSTIDSGGGTSTGGVYSASGILQSRDRRSFFMDLTLRRAKRVCPEQAASHLERGLSQAAARQTQEQLEKFLRTVLREWICCELGQLALRWLYRYSVPLHPLVSRISIFYRQTTVCLLVVSHQDRRLLGVLSGK